MKLLNDFSTSVRKAFEEIDLNWQSYDALVVCGTHSPTGWEKQIELIKEVRQTNRPVLGICFGLQLMAIEFARNIMRIQDATSEEFGVKGDTVVFKREKLKVGLHQGQTYWNNYEVRDDVREKFEEYCKGSGFKFYKGVQYHPEYQSSKNAPHPLLVEFLRVCRN